MTTIVSITGNMTANDTRSGDNMLYLISAVYATPGTALSFTTGSNLEVVFRNGGSIFNTFAGTAISSDTDIRLTVEEGSTIRSGTTAVALTGAVLNLNNFGSIVGTGSGGIVGAANGSTITNYGEIRGSVAYSSLASAGSTINNYGTFSANSPLGIALDLGDKVDSISNYGTIFGNTSLYGGADSVFNSGTMRGSSPIYASGGNKTIVNSGLIAIVTPSGSAIVLDAGDDRVTNLGQILGNVWLGEGYNTFISGENASVTGTVSGGSLADGMMGGANADQFAGGGGPDNLTGGGGDDLLDGGSEYDQLEGGAGSDTYTVDSQFDVVVELEGQGVDTVYAYASYTLKADVEVEYLSAGMVFSGLTLVGNEFAQTITGTTGNDTLGGGADSDVLVGHDGNDTYVLGGEATGVDKVIDSVGVDTITSAITRSLASYAAIENLTLTGTAAVNATGNALANVLTGNTAANVLNGGTGADAMRGLGGNDTYVVDSAGDVVDESVAGSAGVDLVQSSVVFSLADAVHAKGSIEKLTLTGATAVNGTGNALANVIVGNAAANTLDGGAGNDMLNGAAGSDRLKGGLGNDVLTGGAGNDVFVFDTALAAANRDTVADFANLSGNNDTIWLENAVFKKLAVAGPLDSAFFHVGASAADANDYIVYNKATGALYYDADGSGAGGAFQFAFLSNKPALTAGDFVVI